MIFEARESLSRKRLGLIYGFEYKHEKSRAPHARSGFR
jgi:hypothetical protein